MGELSKQFVEEERDGVREEVIELASEQVNESNNKITSVNKQINQ